jgi:hypothetical protein
VLEEAHLTFAHRSTRQRVSGGEELFPLSSHVSERRAAKVTKRQLVHRGRRNTHSGRSTRDRFARAVASYLAIRAALLCWHMD